MLNSKTIDNEFKRLKEYIRTLFRSEKVISDLPKNLDLKEMLEKAMRIFYFLANQKSKTNEANKFVDEYNNLLPNRNFHLSDDYKVDDDCDLIDEINYVNVFIKNIYGVDINTLKKSPLNFVKKILPNQANSQVGIGSNIIGNNQTGFFKKGKEFAAQNAYNNSMNGMNNSQFAESMSGIYSPDNVKRMMAQGMASERLNREIFTGSFYMFKTKPREIIFIKCVISVLYALIGLIAIVLTGLIIANANHQVDLKVLGVGDPGSNGPSSIAVVPGGMALLTVLIVLLVGWIVYKLYYSLFVRRNDNEIYFLRSRNFFFMIVMMGITLAIFNSGQWTFIFRFTKNAADFYGSIGNSDSYWAGIYGSIFWLMIIVCILFGLVAAFYISAIFLNPKQDIERINQVMSHYIDEFLASSNFQK